MTALDTIQDEGIKLDIQENGIDNIIKRELQNYECYYTGDISNAVGFLQQYEITEEQVQEVYMKERHNHTDI